jgi:hypothetical protein
MRMTRLMSALLSVAVVLGIAGCAGARYRTVTYPPRIDLTKHELIGVIEFLSPDEKDLASVVTARFTELARRDQGVVRMISLPSDGTRPDPTRVRELAQELGLRTVLVGELRVSEVRPSVSISDSLSSGSLSAGVEATLAVEMIETETGASLWSATGRTRESLGDLRVHGVKSVDFGAVAPESAYAAMVDALVSQVTRDLQSTWERQRIP